MKNFSVCNTIFSDKFEFKNNTINIFKIENTNYKFFFDCFSTKFSIFKVHRSIFEDFVGFENCEFGKTSENLNLNFVVSFEYVTFLDHITMRKAKFYCGLDIRNANLKEPPNFLDSYIDYNNTDRETFRIIKHSFDNIGNLIEANRYFVFEMNKYKEELLSKKGFYQEKTIYYFSNLLSDHGQSYIKPIVWLLSLSLIFRSIKLGFENNTLYKICSRFNGEIESVSDLLNGVSKSILPFKNLLLEGIEFVSLVFYVVQTILIYQIIVSIKRHTKR